MARVRVLEPASARSPGRRETERALTLAQPAAAARPRGAARRRNRRPRHPRPPARRHRRDLLAVPPVRRRRGGAAHRLAPLGPRRPALCARARMGGGADRLALDRPLGLDGLRVGPRAGAEDRARARARPRARRHASCEAGERVGLLGLMRAARLAPHRREHGRRRMVADRAGLDDDLPPARADRARFDEASWSAISCRPSTRHRGHRRRHLGARRARPSRHDRRSGRGDLPLPGPGRPARSRGRPVAAGRRRRSWGQAYRDRIAAAPRRDLRTWRAAAAGPSPSIAPTGRRARRRCAS